MTDENYASFLESETARMSKAARTTWIVGGIIIVFLFLYFSFILTMAKTFTEPENAAFLVADNVKTNFPSFMETTEALIAERSVYLAEDLSSTFIASVPTLREEAEAQMDLAHTEMIPFVSDEFQEMLTAYIMQHSAEIRILAEEGGSEFTDEFVAGVMDEFGNYMNEQMEESFFGRDLNFVKDNTLIALQAMNAYLDELMALDPSEMNRIQALQKQLLATITRKVIE